MFCSPHCSWKVTHFLFPGFSFTTVKNGHWKVYLKVEGREKMSRVNNEGEQYKYTRFKTVQFN